MQRNGQNPIKSSITQGGSHGNTESNPLPRSTGNVGHCPACKTEVPPKPGFRWSALKCPKCGATMGKK